MLKQILSLRNNIDTLHYDICSQNATLVILLFLEQKAPIESYVWSLYTQEMDSTFDASFCWQIEMQIHTLRI